MSHLKRVPTAILEEISDESYTRSRDGQRDYEQYTDEINEILWTRKQTKEEAERAEILKSFDRIAEARHDRSDNVRPQKLIERYADEFLSAYRSPRTIKTYKIALNDFVNFLASRPDINHADDVTIKVFSGYRDIMESAYAPKTVNLKMTVVKNFWRYLLMKGLIERNEIAFVKGPKANVVTETIAMTRDEVERVYSATLNIDGSAKENNDRIIVTLLDGLALREEEMSVLKWSSFKKERGRDIVKIDGKGEKKRTLYVPPFVMRELEGHKSRLERKTDLTFYQDDYVIQTKWFHHKTKNTEPISPSWVIKCVSRIGERARLAFKITPHVFRATYATEKAERGHTTREIMVQLGHGSITTTEGYIKKNNDIKVSERLAMTHDADRSQICG